MDQANGLSADGQWGSGLVDEGAQVRAAASAIVSSVLGMQVTASSVRSTWLGLRTAYLAPESDLVWAAMDSPRERSATAMRRARELSEVLWTYADQLDTLASRWIETDEQAMFLVLRAAADRECAAAIAALTGPVAPSWGPGAPSIATGPLMMDPATDPVLGSASVVTAQERSPGAGRAFDPLGSLRSDWMGFRPPADDDAMSRALYGYGLLGFAGSTQTTWILSVDYSASRQPFPRDLKVAKAQQGWSTTGSVLDRLGLGLTFVGAARDEWRASDSRATDVRAARTLTMAATTTTGAWAGGQAGVWAGGAIGTALCPGVGTAVGAVLGGAVGGFAGSEAGGWAGDQVVDLGGQAGDLAGDGLDWAGEVTGEALDTARFWD